MKRLMENANPSCPPLGYRGWRGLVSALLLTFAIFWQLCITQGSGALLGWYSHVFVRIRRGIVAK